MKAVIETIKNVFWRDKLALSLIILGLLLNLSGWLILYLEIKPAQMGIIVHYNIFFGIDVFQSSYLEIFEASIGGAIIWFFNFILGFVLYGQMMQEQKKEAALQYDRTRRYKGKDYFLDYFDAKKLSSYLIWGSSLIVQMIILVYVAAILVVNK